jgi:hypothetical protein
MDMGETATYMLRVDRRLWERFKAKLPPDRNLNDAIVELIRRYVEAHE